jgi:hypothetical protein
MVLAQASPELNSINVPKIGNEIQTLCYSSGFTANAVTIVIM